MEVFAVCPEVFSPGNGKQMLCGRGDRTLHCVTHSTWYKNGETEAQKVSTL